MQRVLALLAFAAAVVIGCGLPARADQFWSDYHAALLAFRAGEADGGKYQERAFWSILTDIDGRWTMISALAPDMGDNAAVERACGLMAFDAKRTSDFSFTFTRRSGPDLGHVLEFKYTLVSGNFFSFGANDRKALEYFALDKPESPLSAKLGVLRGANGIAELYRQGVDLLIVKSLFNGIPDIYARCR